jgi:periplasmic protein TonB
MAYPLQQREGPRGAIKAIPPVFWFGAASLLLHLGLLLLWTRPSLSFQVSEGNLPVHVESMGQVAAAQSSQPVSGSPNQPPRAKPIAPERPQKTAQSKNIAAPIPTPKTSVQHQPAAQTAETKPEPKPEKPTSSVKRSPPPVIPSSPRAETPAVIASAATQIESPLASKPKTQEASTDSATKTVTRAEVDQPVKTNVARAGEQDAPASLNSTQLDEVSESATADRLKLHIRKALAAHFRYPLIARKRGWQGEVLLSFDVGSDGRISHAQITRSSGYRALDQAALRALGQVKRVEQAPLVRVSLQLPVTYKLKS